MEELPGEQEVRGVYKERGLRNCEAAYRRFWPGFPKMDDSFAAVLRLGVARTFSHCKSWLTSRLQP